MKKTVLLLFVLNVGLCFGQEKSDSIGFNISTKTPPFSDASPRFSDIFQQPISSSLKMYDIQRQYFNNHVFPNTNLPTFKINYTPILLPTDNYFQQFSLDNRSWISTAHISNNYFGLGGMTLLNASYNKQIGDFMVVSSGIYASKFNAYNHFYNSTGLNGNMKLRVSDRISINMRGQYSVTDNKYPLPMVSSMYPQSFYGGSFEFKVTEKWGIITGADREFDVIQHKWVTRPYILPVFYGK